MLEDRSTQTTVRTYIKVATHSPTHYRGAGSKLKVGTRIPAERAAKKFFSAMTPVWGYCTHQGGHKDGQYCLFVKMACSWNRDNNSVELVIRLIGMPQACITAIRHGTDNYTVSTRNSSGDEIANVNFLWRGLGETYDVHLGLIRKRVMDFILVLIKLFSLGVTVEALRAKIDRKSAISLQRGHFDPKFQLEGVAPRQLFLHG